METREFITKIFNKELYANEAFDILEELTHNYEVDRCVALKGDIVNTKANVLNNLAYKINCDIEARHNDLLKKDPNYKDDPNFIEIISMEEMDDVRNMEEITGYSNDLVDKVIQRLDFKLYGYNMNGYNAINLVKGQIKDEKLFNITITDEGNQLGEKPDKLGCNSIIQSEERVLPVLPLELEFVEKYFKRALEKGYMDITGDKYSWLKGTTKLGYFYGKCYENMVGPSTVFANYFNVKPKNLTSAMSNTMSKTKSIKMITWRNQMNEDIFYD